MIKFKKIRLKNFKNIGGAWAEIDFDDTGFYRIQGRNGCGKCVSPDTKIKIKISDEVYLKISS